MLRNFQFRRIGLDRNIVVTKNTKLQWLRYKINNKNLATKKYNLHIIKILESLNCDFCTTEVEALEHIFGGM